MGFGKSNNGMPSFQSLVAAIGAFAVLVAGGCGDGGGIGEPPPAATRDAGPDTAAKQGNSSKSGGTASNAASIAEARPAPPSETGEQLFQRHCAACHGERGDGQGLAARFLFPRPRNLRGSSFRLVSTTTGVPTRADLQAVLLRGMPGSSMPPWGHLSEADRGRLIDEVLRLRTEGAREKYLRKLKEEDELSDEEIAAEDVQQEIREFVERSMTPGEALAVPQIGEPTSESIASGKEIYVKAGCQQCHGAEGKGDGVQKMVDAEMLPTSPRDFTMGIFKGGHDAESLYRRTAYGMPGTPMPSSPTLTPEQIVDLVHFVRSLSTEEARQAAVLRRERIVARRVGAIPDALNAEAWQGTAVTLRTAPLWWRNGGDRDLTVGALHDGSSLAIRLSWFDGSENLHAPQPERFKDLAAVQLYAGVAEPFLGMGAEKSALDIWQWRAGAGEDRGRESQLDDYPFDAPVYSELADGQPLPDFVAARAAGNPLSDATRSGWSLAAKGPGSLTFMPQPSQLIEANAEWKDGRWTVVLKRPLAVPAEAGLSLRLNASYSAAFAVWDGETRDRAGQKSITIWQDLVLE